MEPADEQPVPATSAAHASPPPRAMAMVPASAHRARRDVRVLAKPPVRKLAKDLGVDLRS